MFKYLQNQFLKHQLLIRWIIVLVTTAISIYWLDHAWHEEERTYEWLLSNQENKRQLIWDGGGPQLPILYMIKYYAMVITFNLLVYLPLYFLWPSKKQS
jgi:hypothetical protein